MGPLSLHSLALPVGEISGASVSACRSGRNVSLACPCDFGGAPHCFQTRIWQIHIGYWPQHHDTSRPRSAQGSTARPGAGSSRDGSEGSPSHHLWGEGAPWLLPWGEERAEPQLCTVCFFSSAGWKHARGPGTPTSAPRFQAQQQPGTFLN